MLKMVLYAMNKEIWSIGRGLSEVQGSAKHFADPVHWGYKYYMHACGDDGYLSLGSTLPYCSLAGV